jgi:hypothetical protein
MIAATLRSNKRPNHVVEVSLMMRAHADGRRRKTDAENSEEVAEEIGVARFFP